MRVLSVNLKVAEALEVEDAAIGEGLTKKQWIMEAIREKLARKSKND